MKTGLKLSATAATLALVGALSANAQTLNASKYQETADTMSTSSSPMQDTLSDDPVKEPANVRGGASMEPAADVEAAPAESPADDMSADTASMGSAVKVKLPNGKIISVNDSAESPWNRSSELSGYDRFTFDPVNNVFVAGKGEAEFAGNWDENGNRVRKVVKATAKKVEVKADEEATTETTTETTTEEITPATEPAAEEAPVAPAQ